MGPDGILPAGDYLQAVKAAVHGSSWWYAPSLFWFGSIHRALMLVTWIGPIASILVVFNIWPRASLLVCFVCFLSAPSSRRDDFSNYQSDGMLLEAGFISLIFRSTRVSSRPRTRKIALSHQSFPLAMGMVPHLFRIGRSQTRQRQRRLAQIHRHGRLLSERPAPHMDRLVCPAIARTGSTLPPLSTLSPPNSSSSGCFSSRAASAFSASASSQPLRNFHHPHRQLHVLELSGFASSVSSCSTTA